MTDVLFVSACLVGLRCRYDGADKRDKGVLTGIRDSRVVFECPETLGGLPTPRPASTIERGDGCQVLAGEARVLDCDGKDVTQAFLTGAQRALKLIQDHGVQRAILKAKSPSCGVNTITRNGRRIKGCGVTAALLRQHGIEIVEK